ncbi:alpha-amylase [Bacteroides sp. 214]|uniref:alpha-amylase family glycosyl hydrolase n=1 Tax=Bacteroides sp. 214 TaxID=2302935 RepID=UPI0013D0D79D|nr:alpha-amylase family glycosyl hydrolase [Bacteroides sp. 214]NDW12720.1 alpha-amylase [Bacteroides sp. 214]
MNDSKIIIYQVLPRLFGNDNSFCIHNGDIKENGCGKLADFNQKALKEIKKIGATHIWYTGIIEHATQTDYRNFNICPDHPAIVKGKAGSPYAIKDYYDVAPDLAKDVELRMREFENLVTRTHRSGLKVIIDFVPNHVARQYNSDAQPKGTKQLGEEDDTSLAFSAKNNFYYIPGSELRGQFDMKGNADESYKEFPAKATGNNRFDAYPNINDWYETIKLNYGVDYAGGGENHFMPIPNTWEKMLDILLFWAAKNIDGFRCDMAEMVPVEFWEWAIPQVKHAYPTILFIAEVYNPNEYNNYLFRGKFDYLYDKVGLYDTLRNVICGYDSAKSISRSWQSLGGIEKRMLNFLENHDEQRIASDYFACDARKGVPGLLVSACMNTNPMMIYFGQEFGERGMDQEGFSGKDGRTTIFDYWSIDTIRRWRNGGSFDGKMLSVKGKELQSTYMRILTMCNEEKAISQGLFFDLMYVNEDNWNFNIHKQYTFLRKHENEVLLFVVNFDEQPVDISINIPPHAFDYLRMQPMENCSAVDLLTGKKEEIRLLPYKPTRVQVKEFGGKVLKVIL